MEKHLSMTISGKVQGVSFRYFVRRVASDHSITGFARNNDDGTVCIEAEGEEQNLTRLLRTCHDGSPNAVVHNVVCAWSEDLKDFTDFKIL